MQEGQVTMLGSELKEKYPELYAEKYAEFVEHSVDNLWYDAICENVKESPEYYLPEVETYFRNYPPPKDGSYDEYHALANSLKGMASLEIKAFDLYGREVDLSYRIDMKRFIKDRNLDRFNGLEQNYLRWYADCVSFWFIDCGWYGPNGTNIATLSEVTAFYQNVFGVGDVTDEMYEALFGIAETLDTWLSGYIDEVKSNILRSLQSEYEWLISEEAFLESEVTVDLVNQ